MKKMCFGSFFTILCQAKLNINQEQLFDLIIEPLNVIGGFDNDKGTVGHYKKGSDLVEAIVNAAQLASVEDLTVSLKKNLLPNLSGKKFKKIVLAIKDILNDETTLIGTTVIGRNPLYTKDSIINSSTFSLAPLLANVLIYSICDVSNSSCISSIREIPKDYIDSFEDTNAKIYFDDNPLRINFELDFTAKMESFNAAFTEVEHTGILPLSNPSNIKIYHLNIQNNQFDFRNIEHFIKTNIGNYVFSRAKRKEYTLNDDVASIGLDAVRELIRSNPSLTLDGHFSEIMLYSFLECALNAPKIMSKVELLNTGGRFSSSSSGIHLLPSSNLAIRNHQLVFGASNILSDLNSAIDNALNQILAVNTNQGSEYDLVENNILNASFPTEVTSYLKNLLIPKKAGVDRPDVAYGVFLGYQISFDNPGNLSNNDYRIKIKEKMKEDIEASIPYIYTQINTLGLEENSFYIYVLPLINIDEDKNIIMSDALGVQR